MQSQSTNNVYVVVQVQSGIPVLAEVFQSKVSAEKREQNLRKEIREDYDALEMFETKLKPAHK